MANEAVIIELIEGGVPINYTKVAGALEKGTLMKMTTGLGTGYRNAEATGADNDPFAGILAAETDATQTTCVCYTKGIFDLTNSGAAVTVGAKVSIKAANQTAVVVADTDNLFSDVGVALETNAGAATVDAVAVGIYS